MPVFPGGGSASGNITPGPGLVPQALGSGFLAAGWIPQNIPDNVRYVSNAGNDSNLGDNETRPLKYIKTAWNQLQALGGGTLYVWGTVDDPCRISADGKGLYIYDYSAGPVPSTSVLPMPVRVIGRGTFVTGFNPTPMAYIAGGSNLIDSTEQDDPGLWISGSIGNSISFENCRWASGTNKPIRIGWDYIRDQSTGAIVKKNVTSAVRSSGTPGSNTVFTVAPYSFDICVLERNAGIVTAQIVWHGKFSEIQQGMQVLITLNTPDPDFTNGWYTLDSFETLYGGHHDGTLVFVSAGNNFSDGSVDGPVIGTVKSTCVKAHDFLTLYSTNAQFPSSSYLVTAINQDTITVNDYYGYGSRSATSTQSNIGTYAAQDRLRHNCAKIRFKNCGESPNLGDGSTETFSAGPGIDIGPLEFFDFEDMYIDGFNIANVSGQPGCRDPERRAMLMSSCGGATAGVGFGEFKNLWGAYGGVRYHCSVAASLTTAFKNVCNDIPVGGGFTAVPAVEILEGADSHSIRLVNISTVDISGTPTIRVNAESPYGCVEVDQCYGPIEGPCTIINYGVQQIQVSISSLPNSENQTGYYGYDRRIAGRHAAAVRSGAPVAAPLPIFGLVESDPTNWQSTTGLTVTTGIRDPFGGTGAVRLTNSSGSTKVATYLGRHVGGASADDDIYVGAIFARGMPVGSVGLRIDVIQSGTTLLTDAAFMPRGGGSPLEWECLTVGGRLAGGASGTGSVCTLQTSIPNGVSIDVYCPTIGFLPVADATDVSDDEVAEIITQFQPMHEYLHPNCVGTRVGQKFIGHDGFGTNSANAKTVGVGSGQLTLTGSGTVYLPMYDKDGTTIIGWVAQLQATVNP